MLKNMVALISKPETLDRALKKIEGNLLNVEKLFNVSTNSIKNLCLGLQCDKIKISRMMNSVDGYSMTDFSNSLSIQLLMINSFYYFFFYFTLLVTSRYIDESV